MRLGYALLITVHTSALIAQSPYRPFPESNAGWAENHGQLLPGGFSDYYTYCDRTIEFGADTVVNGTSYHRLRSRGFCTATYITPPNDSWTYEEPGQTLCLFRQDVAARKVFVYDAFFQQEVLWYDFNLGLGDYPQTWDQPADNGSVQVVALDSMELNDGWHRTWVLGQFYNDQMQDSAYCTVIEGVGSTLGLNTVHGLIPPFEHGDILNCHSRDEAPIYPFGADACDLSVGLTAGPPAPDPMRVFPNPATERVQVIGANTAGWRYALMDLMGNSVQHGLLTGSIDIRDLAPAVYLLQLTDIHGERCVMRVVKN